uniref:Uncharacterized protein n=1 Tax=Oryza sativa subsp. japonica TaxID=39947 RepID=Q69X90_ORYSJ|nr:hypothetical protein [Oryza sativa Japonica Group]
MGLPTAEVWKQTIRKRGMRSKLFNSNSDLCTIRDSSNSTSCTSTHNYQPSKTALLVTIPKLLQTTPQPHPKLLSPTTANPLDSNHSRRVARSTRRYQEIIVFNVCLTSRKPQTTTIAHTPPGSPTPKTPRCCHRGSLAHFGVNGLDEAREGQRYLGPKRSDLA